MSGKRKTTARAGRASTEPAKAAARRLPNPTAASATKSASKSPPLAVQGRARRRAVIAGALGLLLLGIVLLGLRGKVSPGAEKLEGKSVAELQRLATRRPDDVRVLSHYGSALLKQGAANDAAGVFQRVVQLDADNVNAYLDLGRSLGHVGDLGGAETAFKKAAELDPRRYEAHVGLTRLYQENGETPAAIGALEAALRILPNDAGGWYALGDLYVIQQQQDRAARAFERATALVPNHMQGWRALGRAYWQLNRLDEAERSLQRALSLQPKDPYTLLWLAQLYLKRPDTPDNRALAGAALQKATAAGQRPLPEAHLELARLYLRNDQPLLAEASLRSVLRLAPNHEVAHLELGRLLSRGHNPEGKKLLAQYRQMEARRHKLRALETRTIKTPTAPESLLELARLYRGYGDVPKAMRTYRRYLTGRPQDQAVVDEMIAYRQEVRPPPAQSSESEPSADDPGGLDHAGHDHMGHGH